MNGVREGTGTGVGGCARRAPSPLTGRGFPAGGRRG